MLHSGMHGVWWKQKAILYVQEEASFYWINPLFFFSIVYVMTFRDVLTMKRIAQTYPILEQTR